MKYQGLRDLYNRVFFGGVIIWMLRDCKVILDAGCGKNSLIVSAGIVNRAYVLGVDIYEEYIKRHAEKKTYDDYLHADVVELDFKDNAFDAVVLMDVLEHIEKDRVLKSNLLEKMPKWARKVIITTPNGWVGNDESNGNTYQNHLSGWTTKELRQHGYKVRGLSGWKFLREKNSELKFKFPYLFWAGVSLLTQAVCYFIPSQSYHLLATYNRK